MTAIAAVGLYADLDRLASEVSEQVVAWRHDLHAHPELSNRETRTAALAAAHLRSLGLDEVREGIAGHGVVGVLRGGQRGRRVVALRADTDALPVRDESGVPFASTVVDAEYPGGPFPVSHACGHDCHTAMLMGAATVLAGVREHLPGTVLFVFQPAEEGPPVTEDGGAAAMLAAGALADPEPTMVFGMHVGPLPKGHVGYRTGNQFAASTLVKVVVHGQQVHGSTPWLGADPMPAAAAIITGSAQLYRQLPAYNPMTISFGHVEDVGRFNIIGESVMLWGTIRCSAETDMAEVKDRLRHLAQHQAQTFGCTASVAFLQDVPAVRNTPEWVSAGLPTLRRVAGGARVAETPPTLGGDDISVFVSRYGGLYVLLGVQDTAFEGDRLVPVPGGRGVVANHNPGFYADDDSLVVGVRLHAHVAMDHLTGVLDIARRP
ncbi:amidohydrolase [Longispora albida]|uniref:amidohydrolase n=1 Tax=Longispora albida TaxID=203523 RepID=UPI00037F63AE|nr:amidohydrolase [Longispora albida]